MGFLQDKKVLIVGVASNKSIAWGISQAMHREGAELAFTYQNEKLQGRVEKFAAELDSNITLPCDLGDEEQISDVFSSLKQTWGHVDTIVHSAAFAPREELNGMFVDAVTREGFNTAHEISSYSFASTNERSQWIFINVNLYWCGQIDAWLQCYGLSKSIP